MERNSVIILISDFIGLDTSWREHFKIAAKKFDFLFLIMVRDPVDNKMPDDTGQITLEDPFSETKLLVDPQMLSKSYNNRSSELKNKAKAETMKMYASSVRSCGQSVSEKIVKRCSPISSSTACWPLY